MEALSTLDMLLEGKRRPGQTKYAKEENALIAQELPRAVASQAVIVQDGHPEHWHIPVLKLVDG